MLLGLAGDEPVPVRAALRGATDPDLGAVDNADLPGLAKMVDDLGESAQPHARGNGAAPSGKQGRISLTARVMVERSTPNQ
ncbi:hypothetical protein GCM10029992_08950 [Glycomyces albus]